MTRCEAWPDCSCGLYDEWKSEYHVVSMLRRERIRERVDNERTGNVMTSVDLRLRHEAAKKRANRLLHKFVRVASPPLHSDVETWKWDAFKKRWSGFQARRAAMGFRD